MEVPIIYILVVQPIKPTVQVVLRWWGRKAEDHKSITEHQTKKTSLCQIMEGGVKNDVRDASVSF